MPAKIILQARKEDEVVVEGEVRLNIPTEVVEDITITVPNQNGRLLSKEMLGNNTISSSDTIQRPTILTPIDNSINFEGTFVVSEYLPSDTFAGVPTSIIIEISEYIDFSVIHKNIIISELVTEIPVTFETSSSTYYARMKYVSATHISRYSDTVKFTLAESFVHKPKILTPINNSVKVARLPFIEVSSYMYVGADNGQVGLIYEVATDNTFTDIIETKTFSNTISNEIGSGTSPVSNFIMTKGLNVLTDYYIRVKYVGNLYGPSIWSDVVKITTSDIVDTVNELSAVDITKGIFIYDSITIEESNTIILVGIITNSTKTTSIYCIHDMVTGLRRSYTLEIPTINSSVISTISRYGDTIYIVGNYDKNKVIIYAFDLTMTLKNSTVITTTTESISLSACMVDSLGNLVIAVSYSTIPGQLYNEGIILKYSTATKSVLQVKKISLPGNNNNNNTYATNITEVNSSYFFVGLMASNQAGHRVLVFKTDSDLNLQASKLLGAGQDERGAAIIPSGDGGVIVSAISTATRTLLILKFNFALDILLNKKMSGSIYHNYGLYRDDKSNNIILHGFYQDYVINTWINHGYLIYLGNDLTYKKAYVNTLGTTIFYKQDKNVKTGWKHNIHGTANNYDIVTDSDLPNVINNSICYIVKDDVRLGTIQDNTLPITNNPIVLTSTIVFTASTMGNPIMANCDDKIIHTKIDL